MVSPSVWAAVITIISTAVFSVVGWIYRSYQQDITEVEKRVDELSSEVDRLEVRIDEDIEDVDSTVAQISQFLFGTDLNGQGAFAETIESEIDELHELEERLREIREVQDYVVATNDEMELREIKDIRDNNDS